MLRQEACYELVPDHLGLQSWDALFKAKQNSSMCFLEQELLYSNCAVYTMTSLFQVLCFVKCRLFFHWIVKIDVDSLLK